MAMFDKILIANRGEIACRVAATARRMGIRTVAVYSEADRRSRHVAACDEAVAIGPAAAKESYLVADRILAAARATGAQAVHPGYGFLSENEVFGQDCVDAGIVFIGPPPSAIAAMGSKSAAKALMSAAGVPLVPGYHGDDQTPSLLNAEADRIGYPVLIKASAGGGGKGMRVVERSEDFVAALDSCKREAINAFGDDKVLIEKYLQRPRHIEIQLFADAHDHQVYLFERDCSVQRRHQKVLEEAPAPGMSAERRAAMGAAAVAAARAVGYVGAGTVEFIVENDQFFFMEMNTRLQVEHPVTEMITGHDLVEWQLRVAAGESLLGWLPRLQDDLAIHGHAIEARLYAESPERGFLPSIGPLEHLRFPAHVAFDGMKTMPPAATRIDSGVREGDAITPFYDPMIAKLIVWGRDRAEALARMSAALAETEVVGVSTNAAFLSRLVASTPFASADLDTGLIARHGDELLVAPGQVPAEAVLFAALQVLLRDGSAVPASPWDVASGWRMTGRSCRTLSLGAGESTLDATVEYGRGGVTLTTGGTRIGPLDASVPHHELQIGERRVRGHVVVSGSRLHVFTGGQAWSLEWHDPLAVAASGEGDAGSGGFAAPMPGKIVALVASPGAEVARGAPLLVMEAMKMEHTITAPSDGAVEAFLFAPGDQVAEGATLLRFAAKVPMP
ncbi:acetyl/propionyl/methylcrotonyl-CoA carboxylase subunit alpha [soil metagenome]